MKNKIGPDKLSWTEGKVKGFVGKELLNMDHGGVKLVKVTPSSTYPEHIHPDRTEYAYVIHGNPEFSIDNEQNTSLPGDFFIFPAGKKHAIINKSDSECLLLIGTIKN
jgi:quercetin dioxygenase-like cupin family protein